MVPTKEGYYSLQQGGKSVEQIKFETQVWYASQSRFY